MDVLFLCILCLARNFLDQVYMEDAIRSEILLDYHANQYDYNRIDQLLKEVHYTSQDFDNLHKELYLLNAEFNRRLGSHNFDIQTEQECQSRYGSCSIDNNIADSYTTILYYINGHKRDKIYFLTDGTNKVLHGGLLISDPNAGTLTKMLDIIQLIISIVGFVPALGIIADIINVLIYLLRGDFESALYTMISVIPLIGSFIGTPLKYYKKNKKLKAALQAHKMANYRMPPPMHTQGPPIYAQGQEQDSYESHDFPIY